MFIPMYARLLSTESLYLNLTDCQFTERGMEYHSNRSVTASGLTCQRWDRQYPHSHNFTDSANFPDHNLSDAANFCRNPDGRASGPWCFTVDPGILWESCRISRCQGASIVIVCHNIFA